MLKEVNSERINYDSLRKFFRLFPIDMVAPTRIRYEISFALKPVWTNWWQNTSLLSFVYIWKTCNQIAFNDLNYECEQQTFRYECVNDASIFILCRRTKDYRFWISLFRIRVELFSKSIGRFLIRSWLVAWQCHLRGLCVAQQQIHTHDEFQQGKLRISWNLHLNESRENSQVP